MAYGFGTGVQAGLGATDYSNYLRGALSGAEMSAQGQAAIGQGIQNALSSIGVGVQKYMKNKEEKLLLDEATDTIAPLLENPAVRKQYKIPEGATPEAVREAVKKQVKVFGPAAALQLAREARQSAAFEAGIGAVPETITETVETQVPEFAKGSIREFAVSSSPVSVPEQTYEDFIKTGSFMPQAPAMAIDMVSKRPAATAAAREAPAIKPVPKNIEPYFAFNAQTGSFVPTRKLEQDTLAVTSDFQKLEQEKERINSELKLGYVQSDTTGAGRRFGPMPVAPAALMGEQVQARNQRLAEIEQQQEPLKNKLIELGNVRQSAADFGKQPDKKPSVEETASNVIDRSLRFAEEVNLDPVDKNQWLQMKTVLKEIPRKATDGEKIAAFVKAYGEIAPIDSGVYFKMKQLFDTAPVITGLGGGNQLVTANGQSFLIKADDEKKPTSVAQQKLNREELYNNLLVEASKTGLDNLRKLHPEAYDELQKLHLSFGKTNLLGMIFPLPEVVASISTQPANTPPATQLGSKRAAADSILAGR
jgi:hypothetical protein